MVIRILRDGRVTKKKTIEDFRFDYNGSYLVGTATFEIDAEWVEAYPRTGYDYEPIRYFVTLTNLKSSDGKAQKDIVLSDDAAEEIYKQTDIAVDDFFRQKE